MILGLHTYFQGYLTGYLGENTYLGTVYEDYYQPIPPVPPKRYYIVRRGRAVRRLVR